MSPSARQPLPVIYLALLAGMGTSWLLGCSRPEPSEVITAAPVADGSLIALWDSALSVLRKHDLRPVRQDRAMGEIETSATTSQQWGEFWRQDVAELYSLAHASLHTTQRKAVVRFVRGEPGWHVEVQVDVYRLSTPESQITTASSAIQAFSGVLPTTEGQTVQDPQAEHRWVHLGRDPSMEVRLLRQILREAGQTDDGL